MGSERVSSRSPMDKQGDSNTIPFSYTEIFDRCLPYYLSIGMPYELFMDGEPHFAKIYAKADELKRKRKNEELWLQGLYIYETICDVAPILRAFSKAKEPMEYSKEPYPLTDREMQERKERDQRLRYEKMIADMKAFQDSNNRQMTEKQE